MEAELRASEKERAERAIEGAIAMQSEGRLEEAALAFLDVTRLTPGDHRLPDEAGNIYLYGLNRPADAIPCFEKTVALLPKSELRGDSENSAGAINEALEIARRFSGEESVQFINGILDSIRKETETPHPA